MSIFKKKVSHRLFSAGDAHGFLNPEHKGFWRLPRLNTRSKGLVVAESDEFFGHDIPQTKLIDESHHQTSEISSTLLP